MPGISDSPQFFEPNDTMPKMKYRGPDEPLTACLIQNYSHNTERNDVNGRVPSLTALHCHLHKNLFQ